MAYELTPVAKVMTLNEQINECLKIKFRSELEQREAKRKLGRLDETSPDQMQLTEKFRQEIKQAEFAVVQMDDKLELLHEMKAELETSSNSAK